LFNNSKFKLIYVSIKGKANHNQQPLQKHLTIREQLQSHKTQQTFNIISKNKKNIINKNISQSKTKSI